MQDALLEKLTKLITVESKEEINVTTEVLACPSASQMIRDGLVALVGKPQYDGILRRRHLALESEALDMDSRSMDLSVECFRDNLLYILRELVRGDTRNSFVMGVPDESCYQFKNDPFPMKFDAEGKRIREYISVSSTRFQRLEINPAYEAATDVRYVKKITRPIYAVTVHVRLMLPENGLRAVITACDLIAPLDTPTL